MAALPKTGRCIMKSGLTKKLNKKLKWAHCNKTNQKIWWEGKLNSFTCTVFCCQQIIKKKERD